MNNKKREAIMRAIEGLAGRWCNAESQTGTYLWLVGRDTYRRPPSHYLLSRGLRDSQFSVWGIKTDRLLGVAKITSMGV